jgi:hypothetical protein
MSSRGCARRPREKSLEGPRSPRRATRVSRFAFRVSRFAFLVNRAAGQSRADSRADLASPPCVRFVFHRGDLAGSSCHLRRHLKCRGERARIVGERSR